MTTKSNKGVTATSYGCHTIDGKTKEVYVQNEVDVESRAEGYTPIETRSAPG
jgi:hypothetical protein